LFFTVTEYKKRRAESKGKDVENSKIRKSLITIHEIRNTINYPRANLAQKQLNPQGKKADF
jgi:hypothetical protein